MNYFNIKEIGSSVKKKLSISPEQQLSQKFPLCSGKLYAKYPMKKKPPERVICSVKINGRVFWINRRVYDG